MCDELRVFEIGDDDAANAFGASVCVEDVVCACC